MINLTDEDLIKGFKEQDSICINQMYKLYFPLAKSIAERNSGSIEDAEDLFQDSMVVLYKRLHKESIVLNCSLKTFFYGICKNIWLQRLDKKWRLIYSESLAEEPSMTYYVLEKDYSEEVLEKKRLFQKHFLTLPGRCQRLLSLCMKNVPLRTIAKELGLKNEEYAKARKYSCKNMLRKKILNDPRCKPYLNYE
jgi:RNA polymerase sigma factor (sigma-70 family)